MIVTNEGKLNYKVAHLTVADMMSIEETSIWIWTFGFGNGWEEATYYATAFKRNGISGKNLPELTDEKLKGMSISNFFHRMTILYKIKQLFPSYMGGDISSVTGTSVRSIDGNLSDGYDDGQSCEGMEHPASSSQSLQYMDCSTSSSQSLQYMDCS